jgi:hypothetical protein
LCGGIPYQPLEQLPEPADLVLAEARLPLLLGLDEDPSVLVLGPATLRSEENDLSPARSRVWFDHDTTEPSEEPHRHGDRFLRNSCQARKVPDAHSRLIEDPQRVGACGERQVRLALEVDSEHEQGFGEENRQVRPSTGAASRDDWHSPVQALEACEHVDRDHGEVLGQLCVALVDEHLERLPEPADLLLAEATLPSLLDLIGQWLPDPLSLPAGTGGPDHQIWAQGLCFLV